jgi:flagellar FliL protein
MANVDEKGGKGEVTANGNSSKMKMVMLFTIGAIVLIGTSIGGTFMLARSVFHASVPDGAEAETESSHGAESSHGKAAKAEKKKKGKKEKSNGDSAVYLSLDPPFVVNSQDQGASRFLQVTVELMSYDPVAIEDMKKHMPLIRNSLVMLLSSQMAADVKSREGKEKLRAIALEEVQKVLEEQTGKSGVEQLYFTSFVIQ